MATEAGRHVGLLWSDDDVAQGFAWDRDIVAFGVPDHDGECQLSVTVDAPHSPPVVADALWVVAAPFVATGSTIEVGSLFEQRSIATTPGARQLVFQARPGGRDYAFRLDLTLIRSDAPTYGVLKQGPLVASHVLREQARRA